MKWLLRSFALLDIICIVLLWQPFSKQIISLTSGQSLQPIIFFSRTLFAIGWVSLFTSAAYLLIPKKTGIYIYYAQLPVRLIFSIYSLGFTSLITLLSNAIWLNKAIIPLVVFAELCRLCYSYKAYDKLS